MYKGKKDKKIKLCLPIKLIFFFKACIKEAAVLTFLMPEFIFDHIFGSKRIYFFDLYSFYTELCQMP